MVNFMVIIYGYLFKIYFKYILNNYFKYMFYID